MPITILQVYNSAHRRQFIIKCRAVSYQFGSKRRALLPAKNWGGGCSTRVARPEEGWPRFDIG